MITATFWLTGSILSDNDLLQITVIKGSNSSKTCMKIPAEMESNEHDLTGDCRIISQMSCIKQALNWLKLLVASQRKVGSSS